MVFLSRIHNIRRCALPAAMRSQLSFLQPLGYAITRVTVTTVIRAPDPEAETVPTHGEGIRLLSRSSVGQR